MCCMNANAGHEGEATTAHNNIANVANENASWYCLPVSSGSYVAYAIQLTQQSQPS